MKQIATGVLLLQLCQEFTKYWLTPEGELILSYTCHMGPLEDKKGPNWEQVQAGASFSSLNRFCSHQLTSTVINLHHFSIFLQHMPLHPAASCCFLSCAIVYPAASHLENRYFSICFSHKMASYLFLEVGNHRKSRSLTIDLTKGFGLGRNRSRRTLTPRNESPSPGKRHGGWSR